MCSASACPEKDSPSPKLAILDPKKKTSYVWGSPFPRVPVPSRSSTIFEPPLEFVDRHTALLVWPEFQDGFGVLSLILTSGFRKLQRRGVSKRKLGNIKQKGERGRTGFHKALSA